VVLIVFSFVSSKLNKNFLSVVGQDIKSWFESAMICLVCTSVEFVLSIVIKSVVNYIICTNVEFVLSIVIKWFKF